MKKIITLLLAFTLSAAPAIYAQQATTGSKTSQPKKDGPELTLKEDNHDFGKIQEGVVATYEFKFTNTGTKPLLLTEVRASCGCTTPFYPKEPIMPGQSGVIKVAYNSLNRPGVFNKTITIVDNVEGDVKVLFIKGEVTPNPNSNTQDPNQSPVRLNNG
jgi:hypothetical protein